MRIPEPVKAPSSRELLILQFLIIAGVAAMGFLLFHLFKLAVIDNPFLYGLLITAITFACLKLLHEWYHYFYITVPPKPAQSRQYTVDILTTYCAGEPYEMMLETLTAIQAITYPHETYLCDEADDPYLKQLCVELGIHHVTRTKKINAKAGNINNALQQAKGEICVILDPDHVPLPNFLESILPQFGDEKVGFVQIVQAYKNFHESLVAKGAAQQTFQFYGPMMMTMNKYGTVLAIGANCSFRRAALDSIGGHAPGLAEDMHTAMQLHAKGWKSVYVPEVLARGLVPSTLSAYYSQQLKWSRGVFELLVTSYIKLFKQFTWRQKLHYGIIPFYYLSGIIFLINFTIPVLSLILEVNPVKMDFNTFALIGLPLVIQIILIRNYVQRWVMEDEERGFHIAGGLLAIGTWWVFILGLVYTVIRKKVPYVPTPKDANEENNWPLNIPNLVVLGMSLFAIFYGLYIDWNPYTFVMAGLAGVNCLIMTYNIVASRQITFRNFKDKHTALSVTARHIFKARQVFWRKRLKVYSAVRQFSLVLCLITIASTLYVVNNRQSELRKPVTPIEKNDIFLTGIFAPATTNGLTSMHLVESYGAKFDLISLYVAWGDKGNGRFPKPLVDSIYSAGAYPMISWEPWQNLFSSQNADAKDTKVFKKITEGHYDFYLKEFSRDIRELDRPVFLRFAHEADNPFYPWSPKGLNSAEEFKAAWKYIHTYFVKQGASNVIWVWNPWKPEAVKTYFPGREYVDWIGITNLNYGPEGPDKRSYSLEELYSPFHKQVILRSGIPVMLAETGSLRSVGQQHEWFEAGLAAIKKKFPEIKALVLFNSSRDKNIPEESRSQLLDWSISKLDIILASNVKRTSESNVKSLGTRTKQTDQKSFPANGKEIMVDIKGINYSKGLNWLKNYNTLRTKEIDSDFQAINHLGFTTIKRYGPNVYDSSILKAADAQKLKIVYAFYIPDDIDFINGHEQMNELRNTVLKTVRERKGNNTILSWNLGNTPYQKLENSFYKPQLIYNQFAFAKWLRDLISEIKLADPTRQVSIDMELNGSVTDDIAFLEMQVPGIDSYGLVVTERSPSQLNLTTLNVPHFISKIPASIFLKRNKKEGYFISDWQDQELNGLVTFDGLRDNWGRNKVALYRMGRVQKTVLKTPALPKVKILKPAVTLYANGKYKYHALVDSENEWKIAGETNFNLEYRWYLVKTDSYGNGTSMKLIGSGANVSVKIPEDGYKHYQLYLNAYRGNDVSTAKTKLNIPLVSPGL